MRVRGLLAAGACVSADDSSTLLSLRSQTKLHQESESQSYSAENFMNVIQGHNVTQMASLVQSFVESQLYGDGVTETDGDVKLDADIAEALKTIKQLLLGDIQAALKNEHKVDQKFVDELHKCWDACKTANDEDQDQVQEFWGIMQSSKESHETCREDVHGKYVDKVTKCNALDKWSAELECPKCIKEECVVVKDPESRTIGDMLQAHLTWATDNYEIWQRLHAACVKAVIAHEDADTKCDKTQSEFESNTCSHRQAVWTACNVNQMACCARCSADFDAEVNRVECAEKDRKIDWSATKKIECYIDVLMKSPTDEELNKGCKEGGKSCINQFRENMYKKCDDVCVEVDFESDGEYREIEGVNTTHRTDSSTGDRCTEHLDIDFPMKPRCAKCPPPVPGPCEFPFLSTYYALYDDASEVEALEDEKECNPDKHTHEWAYSRAQCTACAPLIGRTPASDPSCFFGNEIRIEDNGHANGYLNIMEVIVNDGVEMTAKLSSTWPGWDAHRCLDGKPDTGCHSGTNQPKGWWAAFTLEEPTCITSIKIINRKDCCTGRFVGADITLLNQGTEIWTDRVEEDKPEWEWILPGHDIKDDCEGWSRPERKMIDGTCFLGAYGPGAASTKKFTGFRPGCLYKMKGIMDSWASVDHEKYTISVNGKSVIYDTRGAVNCNQNGWQSHDYGFGRQLGSGGSGKHGWKDCYKPFEIEFLAPADGEADVSMRLAINQVINDEAWGFHDIEFELTKCGLVADDGSGWSEGRKHVVDGTTYLGAFTVNHRVRKTFTGLGAGCTYNMRAVIDTWASTDRETFEATVNGVKTVWGSNEMRHAGDCDRGWNFHPDGLGVKVGSPGSHKGGWKDCWKSFTTKFKALRDGSAHVEFHIAVNQHIDDEGWGFHNVVFEQLECPAWGAVEPVDLPLANCQSPPNAKACHFWGDPHFTHLFFSNNRHQINENSKGGWAHGGSILEFRPQGLMNLVSTADRSFEAQAFFCPWSGNAPGVSNGIAMRFGDDIIQLLKSETSGEYTDFIVNGKKVSWEELGDSTSQWGKDVSGNGGLVTKFMYMQQMKTNRHNGHNRLPVCAGNGEDTLIEIGNHGNYNRFWQGVTIRTSQPGAEGICSVPNGQMADNPTVQEEYRVDLRHSLFNARQIKHLCSVCNLEMHDHICGAPGVAAKPEDVCKTANADFEKASSECGKEFTPGSSWFDVCVMETCASGEDAAAISKIEEHLQELMIDEE